jgi:hypothetical protein
MPSQIDDTTLRMALIGYGNAVLEELNSLGLNTPVLRTGCASWHIPLLSSHERRRIDFSEPLIRIRRIHPGRLKPRECRRPS